MNDTTDQINLTATLSSELSERAVRKSQEMVAAHDLFQERLAKTMCKD